MGVEIERKFLVDKPAWLAFRAGLLGIEISQGYLSTAKECTVRVRIAGVNAFVTIKGAGVGLVRPEYEYAIPPGDAREMLATLCSTRIEKTRWHVKLGEHIWDVDEFHGDNNGLIVAEVELESEEESFQRPTWLSAEVTHDPRYLNANLVVRPFCSW